MIVLVTRPLEQGQALAERLRQRGHQALLLPLLRIEPIAEGVTELPRAVDGAQAVLFTSANGVRAFAAASPRRDLRAFAVGDQTAAAATEAGFAAVESAGGDVASLAALVAERLRPEAGALVHGAGETTAGDLVGALEKHGYEVRRVTLYRTEPAAQIDTEIETALRAHRIGAALFYSPRTAAIFVTLIGAANLQATLANTAALALSPAVAAVLAPLPWARLLTAREPREAALLDALDLVASAEDMGSSPATMSESEIIPPSSSPGSDAADPAAVPPPAPPPRQPREGGRGWTLGGLGLALTLAAAALAGVAYLLWFAPPPAGNAAANGERLHALETRIAAMQTQLDAAKQDRAQAGELAPRLAALEQQVRTAATASAETAGQLRTLTERIAALEQRLANPPDDAAALAALQAATKSLEAETQSLAQKLETQSSALAALAAHQQQATGQSEAALLIALQQLRLALASSDPFAAPLHTAEALAQDHPDLLRQLQGLDARAEQGIPTLVQLTARFEPMASRALEAAPAPAEGGWLADAGSFLMRFFDVRRESGGSDSESALAAAHSALRGGDLAGAIAALKRLPAPSAAAASTWIVDAEARRDAEQRLKAIDTAVAQWVTSAPQKTTP